MAFLTSEAPVRRRRSSGGPTPAYSRRTPRVTAAAEAFVGRPATRRIAKSQLLTGYEVNRLLDIPTQGVGPRPQRPLVLRVAGRPQHRHDRVQQHREAQRHPRPLTVVPVLVPPPILDVVQTILHLPI